MSKEVLIWKCGKCRSIEPRNASKVPIDLHKQCPKCGEQCYAGWMEA